LIGQHVAPFILEEDREKVRKAYASLSPENPVATYEQRVTRPDGEIRWQEWTDHAVFDDKGKMVEVQGVGRDVTERKLLEEKLRRAERMAGIGETAAMVGHDLRNPLQVMVNRLYLAKKASSTLAFPYSEAVSKLGLQDLFNEFEDQVGYMNKIVSDLQDYARPLKPIPVETSLNQLFDDTFSMVKVPEGVKVSRIIEKDFPKLAVDATLMRRVFTNLILNALQVMPNGGRLTIKASKAGDEVLISIKDTGVGIPTEDLEKIWSPLHTTKAKGVGLGLPVCKRLVEAHDGNIIVESKVGEGSTFTVKLPFRKGAT
jgi:signal transduction histidine kinase